MDTLVAAIFAICALLPLGCRSDTASACNDCDASPPGDGTSGSNAAIKCTTTDVSFPAFDKTCTTAGDCAFGIHQTDCCGATRAIGFAKAEQARFAEDERICMGQYAACGCPAFPTVTEDGRSATGGAIVVDCLSGRCMTTVR